MTSLLSRVKKLETAWNEKNPSSHLRVVVVYPGESEASAIARANIGPYQRVILVSKFAKKNDPIPKQPKPKKTITKTPEQIDREIEALKRELKQSGLSELEIIELMAESEKSKSDTGLLNIEPSRSDVGRLTR